MSSRLFHATTRAVRCTAPLVLYVLLIAVAPLGSRGEAACGAGQGHGLSGVGASAKGGHLLGSNLAQVTLDDQFSALDDEFDALVAPSPTSLPNAGDIRRILALALSVAATLRCLESIVSALGLGKKEDDNDEDDEDSDEEQEGEDAVWQELAKFGLPDPPALPELPELPVPDLLDTFAMGLEDSDGAKGDGGSLGDAADASMRRSHSSSEYESAMEQEYDFLFQQFLATDG